MMTVIARQHSRYRSLHRPESASQYHYDQRSSRSTIRSRWFSKTEILHLVIGTLLVLAVGLSIPIYQPKIDILSPLDIIRVLFTQPLVVLGSAVVFASVFLPHELAHKAAAKSYGLWAEFRLTLIGVLLTLLSVISPIKLVAPGAVVIAGTASRRTIGRTALAGPLTNVLLSILFIGLSKLASSGLLSVILGTGAALSSWIALFNLIPFSVFDGAKIFWWSKITWVLIFLTSIALTIYTILLL